MVQTNRLHQIDIFQRGANTEKYIHKNNLGMIFTELCFVLLKELKGAESLSYEDLATFDQNITLESLF